LATSEVTFETFWMKNSVLRASKVILASLPFIARANIGITAFMSSKIPGWRFSGVESLQLALPGGKGWKGCLR
jgi:hypothetical protein